MRKYSALGQYTPGNKTYTTSFGVFDSITAAIEAKLEDENGNTCTNIGVWDDESSDQPEWRNEDGIITVDMDHALRHGLDDDELELLTGEEIKEVLLWAAKEFKSKQEDESKRKLWRLEQDRKDLEKTEYAKFKKYMEMYLEETKNRD